MATFMKVVLILVLVAEGAARLFGYELWPCPETPDDGCYQILHRGSVVATLQGPVVILLVALGVALLRLYKILR